LSTGERIILRVLADGMVCGKALIFFQGTAAVAGKENQNQDPE
jgi:hypothetical protein